jgi:hypothetical protein
MYCLQKMGVKYWFDTEILYKCLEKLDKHYVAKEETVLS